MILSVHQPQYLPWLGYFHKIANSGLFIFLDDVQYKKREFQNRNKIKSPGGQLWLTVPVITKGRFEQNISEVLTGRDDGWEQSHWKTIEHNYAGAPFYRDHEVFFRGLYGKKWARLMDVSLEVINYCLDYLDIRTPRRMSSEFSVGTASTQRIIDLCKSSGADTYLSGAGGREYMDVSLFEKNGIRLTFQDFRHPVYTQLHGDFIPFLSIVDLLMNCGRDSRKVLLSS